MKVRDVYVAKSQTLADSGSWTWSLNAFNAIQHLRIQLKATNGATSNTVGKLKNWVSKIEIVDGANVICSCSGLEWFAIDCFCNRETPFHDLSGGAGVTITDELLVPFGRFVGDREYYLNTQNYKNPLLRITFAYTVSATAGVATGTETVSIIARTIEDAALPYKGFIMRKEINSFTSASSGDQPVVLPLDFDYMGFYVSALKTTVEPDTIITNYKLTRNIDQFIDYSITGRDAHAKNYEDFGPFHEKFRPLADTSSVWLGDLYFKTGAVMSKPGATSKGLTTAVTAESVTTVTTTGGTADLNEVELFGLAPAAAVYLPVYAPNDYDVAQPDDFLHVAGLNDLRLILTQAVVSASCTVVAEQLHP